jgi:hypothetical protein
MSNTYSQFRRVLACYLSIAVLFWYDVNGQCSPAAPAIAGCSGGNGAATNGVNINGGQTFWFSGGPTTFGSGVNLNGGTLRICGNLTLSSISFNSGSIIVESGGQLTINGGGDLYMNGSSNIVNRGTLTINRNLRMQNSNNTVWNAAGGNFTVSGIVELNSATSRFNNAGTATFGTLHIQSSAAAGNVCLQHNSCTNVTNVTNSVANGVAFSGPGSEAAFRVTGNAQLNQNFCNQSQIEVCRGASSTTSGGAGWGSASVTTNCSGCSVLLPVVLSYFKASRKDKLIKLKWKIINETNNSFYTVERSTDGASFREIRKLLNIPGRTHYEFFDSSAGTDFYFYRLKQTDFDGNYSYSRTVRVEPAPSTPTIGTVPSIIKSGQPFTVNVSGLEPATSEIAIVDAMGRLLFRKVFVSAAPATSIQVPGLLVYGTLYMRLQSGTRRMIGKCLVL